MLSIYFWKSISHSFYLSPVDHIKSAEILKSTSFEIVIKPKSVKKYLSRFPLFQNTNTGNKMRPPSKFGNNTNDENSDSNNQINDSSENRDRITQRLTENGATLIFPTKIGKGQLVIFVCTWLF